MPAVSRIEQTVGNGLLYGKSKEGKEAHDR